MKTKYRIGKKAALGLFFLIFVMTSITGLAETMRLVPIGQTVGVILDMKGVTIVDTTDVEGYDGKRSAPAKDAGLHAGDIIEKINGEAVDSAKDLERIVTEQGGAQLTITAKRGSDEKIYSVTPALSSTDGNYRLGVWIKDAASGIGTVTYLNPETLEFGALGHGISETPEGQAISMKDGEILDASIVSIQKGDKGKPGELVGIFAETNKKLGTVTSNTDVGLKGKLDDSANLSTVMEAIPVAERSEVTTGDAEILTNIEEGSIQTFSVEIQKINKDAENPKGMVLKVTDRQLLDKTGGIVQGMSGSPIIQNGKLVGAVTHVFVNDPTRGYGIFIENMLEEGTIAS